MQGFQPWSKKWPEIRVVTLLGAPGQYMGNKTHLQDGAPKIAKLPYKWLNMVDITIVNGGYNGL